MDPHTVRVLAKGDCNGPNSHPMWTWLKVASGDERGALLVPQGAIGVDQNKKFVYVVGSDNKVAYREVQFGKQVGDKRMVLSGLAAGERVIVDGLQHVRPATLVDAKEVDDAPSAQASRL